MGVFENATTGSSRIRRACVIFKHVATFLLFTRNIPTIFRFQAIATQFFPDVDPQQDLKEAA
jgi:hypothetical protein